MVSFRIAGGGGLDVDAVQHLMEQHAVDAAPSAAQLERHGVPELGDGEDAGAVKPLLHARADAVDLSCNSSPEQTSLLVCALSAIFLIQELHRSFEGMIDGSLCSQMTVVGTAFLLSP